MKAIRSFFLLVISFFFFSSTQAQLEAGYARMKGFESFGFGGFINVSTPIGEADYLSFDMGLNWYKNSMDEDIAFAPLLAGYRYTIDRSGSGFFVEPFAGYTFGETSLEKLDENGLTITDVNGEVVTRKIAGPSAGIMGGYLFQLKGNSSLVLGLRYLHNFAPSPSDVISLRLAYSFSLWRARE